MGPTTRRVRARVTTGAEAQNRGSIRGVAGLPSPLGQSQSSSSSSMALGAIGVPSPLGQSQSSSSSPIALGGVQAFSSTLSENNLENSGSSSNASHRKWTSAVWEHYDKYDGKNFDDGIPRAVCMYCKGGPMLADSGMGTSNFKRHTEGCEKRPIGEGEMVVGENGTLIKKINHFLYKEKVALAIIRHGYPFTYAEHEGNRDVHLYLNDSVKFISRNTGKNYCMKIHKREKMSLKTQLAQLSGKICLTCDMWTSCVDQGYLSLTGHYIDDEWNLHAKILNFYHLEPPHDAKSMHEKLLEFIADWEIEKKVFTVTLDNARCNDNMQGLLAASLKVHSPLLCDGKYFHVRCGAHILNLIVQEGLKLVDAGVPKVKKLVTYIGCSERRTLRFKEIVKARGLDCSKGLYMDCPTRWNSTFKMLCRALYFREAFESMSSSTSLDTTFPPLPTNDEWVRIIKICALLKPFDEITTLMSGRKYPTSNLYLKCVWKIEKLLLDYSKSQDALLSDMAQKMKVKFDKYWESYSLILSFAAILDPRFKFEFVRYCFKELDEGTAEDKSNFIKAELYNLFDEYVQRDPSTVTSQPQSIQDELPGFAAFADNVRRVSSTQLDMYLDEARVSHTLEIDVLSWWRENEQRFPKVADMAKDILAIPVTTVASESAFSMGSRLITRWRSSLKPETADALLTTRTWLYGFEVKEATNENQMLDGFEYEFSTLQINEAEVDDEEDDDHELV